MRGRSVGKGEEQCVINVYAAVFVYVSWCICFCFKDYVEIEFVDAFDLGGDLQVLDDLDALVCFEFIVRAGPPEADVVGGIWWIIVCSRQAQEDWCVSFVSDVNRCFFGLAR